MPSHSYDAATTQLFDLKRTIESYSESDLSEMDTRVKIIDTMLIKVLGWNESEIRREVSQDGKYADYVLQDNKCILIVEAKRLSREIRLPGSSSFSVKSLCVTEKELVNQARTYCTQHSASCAVLTNGFEWVLCTLNRVDGVKWDESKCLVFRGINAVERNFHQFYDQLAYINYSKKRGFNFDTQEPRKGSSPLYRHQAANDEIARNTLGGNLIANISDALGSLSITEDLDSIDKLKACFVETDDVQRSLNNIDTLFRDLRPGLAEVNADMRTTSLQTAIEDSLAAVTPQVHNQSLDPIIIIGAKGVGKSTFLSHLEHIRLKSNLSDGYIFLKIDCSAYSISQLNDPSYMDRLLLDQLLDYDESYHKLPFLKRAYRVDLERGASGVWAPKLERDPNLKDELYAEYIEEQIKDRSKHLERLSLCILADRRRRVCIIIDNADQFPLATQKSVYLYAQSLTGRVKAIAIVALREGFWHQYRNTPPFDAYQPTVFHLTAPPFIEILQRRLSYLAESISSQKWSLTQESARGIRIRSDEVSPVKFVDAVKQAIVSPQSEVGQYVVNMSYPNLRSAIELVKDYLTSGYVNVGEIIARAQSQDTMSPVNIWEFFKAVVLQNRIFLPQINSKVLNIFSPVCPNGDHFLRLAILNRYNQSVVNSEGFLSTSALFEEFMRSGYEEEDLVTVVQDMFVHRLLEGEDSLSDVSPDLQGQITDTKFRCTGIGRYFLESVIPRFHYIEVVAPVTEMYDDNFVESIYQAVAQRNHLNASQPISERKKIVDLFLEYLKLEIQNVPNISRIAFQKCVLHNDKLKTDLRRITGSTNYNF